MIEKGFATNKEFQNFIKLFLTKSDCYKTMIRNHDTVKPV